MVSLINNTPILSSKYHLLESLSIDTSDLKNNPLHAIKLKNIMKEVTSFKKLMILKWDCWGGRVIS